MICFKRKSALPQQDLDYLLEHTQYKEKEIKKWYKSFMKDFPKGHLTMVKFIDAFKMLFPNGNAERFCEQVFDAFDSDGKGGINFKEFIMAMDSNRSARSRLKWAFKLYDTNGDTYLDREEITKAMEAVYDMLTVKRVTTHKENNSIDTEATDPVSLKDRVEDIFSRLDENGDGVITEDEFLRVCLQDDDLRNMLEPAVEQ